MSEQPYVPFYKPYGMSDEEYQSEVSAAQERLAEWESQQVDEAGDEQTRIFIDKIRSELTAELLAKIEEMRSTSLSSDKSSEQEQGFFWALDELESFLNKV